MSIKLGVPETNMITLKPRISVIGVGGGGGNAVNNMITKKLEGVDFIVANTDAQALANSKATCQIQLGIETTHGLGAGADPKVGCKAAEEAEAEIAKELEGANMVFITAGMGGGTGSGAAPVVARIAKAKGILTIGVITKPFQFEGKKRSQIAEEAVSEFVSAVDSIIIIPNQNLFRIADKNTTLADAFVMADNVLYSGVRSITDLMMMPGLINLDFADIKSIMEDKGRAIMGTGEAEGENRAIRAAEEALCNPLLDDSNMKGARGVLINITGGMDITLFEVDEAANRIKEEVDENAQIIFGSSFDESLNGKIRVSIVATGIQDANPNYVETPKIINQKNDYIAESYTNEALAATTTNEDLDSNLAMFSATIEPTQEEPSYSADFEQENFSQFQADIEEAEITSVNEAPIEQSIEFEESIFDEEIPEIYINEEKEEENNNHLSASSSAINDIPQASSLFSAINKGEKNDIDTQLKNILSNQNNKFSPKNSTHIIEEEPELFSHNPQTFNNQRDEAEKFIVNEEDEYTPTLIERVTGFSIAKRNRRKKTEPEHYQEPTSQSFIEDNDNSGLDLEIPSFLRRK